MGLIQFGGVVMTDMKKPKLIKQYFTRWNDRSVISD